eukprot:TRINITY_DN7008_c0_g1_i2.p2 TRINITY_DN7008_c0_g1~~TRINITY_DN7008_c0_g1_i2.p2  ORF type:complete len:136 (-),score=13.64 TRINITY_DN7008_c0_g1_i2:147-554(-)
MRRPLVLFYLLRAFVAGVRLGDDGVENSAGSIESSILTGYEKVAHELDDTSMYHKSKQRLEETASGGLAWGGHDMDHWGHHEGHGVNNHYGHHDGQNVNLHYGHHDGQNVNNHYGHHDGQEVDNHYGHHSSHGFN